MVIPSIVSNDLFVLNFSEFNMYKYSKVFIIPVNKINIKNLSTSKSFIWKILVLKRNNEKIISNNTLRFTAKFPIM